MKKIIAITGLKGSGKSTAAACLLRYPLDWTEVKFAGALKRMLRSYLRYVGVDDYSIQEMIEGELKEKPSEVLGKHTPRFAMQSLGTEWGRNLISDSMWIDATDQKINNTYGNVVITDLRFPNEYDFCKKIGAKVIKIVRPTLTNGQDLHSSEQFVQVMKADHEIINDGTKMDLWNKVYGIVNS